jgi:hypothetical protein
LYTTPRDAKLFGNLDLRKSGLVKSHSLSPDAFRNRFFPHIQMSKDQSEVNLFEKYCETLELFYLNEKSVKCPKTAFNFFPLGENNFEHRSILVTDGHSKVTER